MALAAAALKKASLVVAVCVVLLHSSLGQQQQQQPQPPASPDCPYTGQQPPPSPTPVEPAPTPTPMLTPPPLPAPMPSSPAPAPAPTPVNNCSYSDCASQCDQSCRATSSAGIANCQQSDHAVAFNACYESCTSRTCPGKSCVHGGCGFGDCSCHNRNASSCCEWCGNAVSSSDPVYQRCLSYWERSVGYCVMSCQDSCSRRGCV